MTEAIRTITLPDGRVVTLTRRVTFDLTVRDTPSAWDHTSKQSFEVQSDAEAAFGRTLADALDTATRAVKRESVRPLGVAST